MTVKDIMQNIGIKDGEAQAMLTELLDLPDDQFDSVFPEIVEGINESMHSSEVRQAMLEELKKAPIVDLEVEMDNLNSIIEDINNDDSLSIKKRELLTSLIGNTADIIAEIVDNPREKVNVGIYKLDERAVIPQYAHKSDAGADVCALEETKIPPHSTVVVKTGLVVDIPVGYEIQIRPRSGMSAKTTLIVANAPGTIDSGYHGEVGIILKNIGNLTVTIEAGQKIAQMIIAPVPMINWIESDVMFDETERGAGGFGSTDEKK